MNHLENKIGFSNNDIIDYQVMLYKNRKIDKRVPSEHAERSRLLIGCESMFFKIIYISKNTNDKCRSNLAMRNATIKIISSLIYKMHLMEISRFSDSPSVPLKDGNLLCEHSGSIALEPGYMDLIETKHSLKNAKNHAREFTVSDKATAIDLFNIFREEKKKMALEAIENSISFDEDCLILSKHKDCDTVVYRMETPRYMCREI